MKIDEVNRLAQFAFPKSADEQKMIHEYLRSVGIEPENLYQELEMSSRFVNTHQDATFSASHVSLHSHNYYEMIFCRSNCDVEYLIGSDRYRLQRGDIVLLPPGVSHRPILPEVLKEPYVRDVLWISMEFISHLHQLFPDMMDHLGDHTVPIRTAGTRWEFLEELFRTGIREEEEKRPGWEMAVIGNTMTIFTHLRRIYMERSAGTMKAETPELLDRIAGFVEENYASHITLDDLARRFYVSSSTISHLFKQKMGLSLYRYVTQRRLIAAKNMIGEKIPMEEIAHRVGFTDYSTFYRAFKQEFGISPRQFGRL